MNVIISSTNQDSVDNTIQEILNKFSSKKGNILGLKCDVSKYSDIKSLVNKSIKRFGRLIFLLIMQVQFISKE